MLKKYMGLDKIKNLTELSIATILLMLSTLQDGLLTDVRDAFSCSDSITFLFSNCN